MSKIIKPRKVGKAKPKILGFNLIKLDQIKKSENPIRSKYTNIAKLAQSIKSYGLIHPILVRPISNPKYNYEVIAGHRRFLALQRQNAKEEWCAIVPEDLDDYHALFYTGIENIHQEYVDKIDKGKWALSLKGQINPDTGKVTTIKDIADIAGVEPQTLAVWIRAAETATNLELASKESKEQVKSFFYKLKTSVEETVSENKMRFTFPKSEDIGTTKLDMIQRFAKTPEETGKLAVAVAYKDLTKEETKKFVDILREHPEEAESDEFILKTATEVKGTIITVKMSHRLRNAISDYAQESEMTMEEKIIEILEKSLEMEGYY